MFHKEKKVALQNVLLAMDEVRKILSPEIMGKMIKNAVPKQHREYEIASIIQHSVYTLTELTDAFIKIKKS